MSGEFWPLYSEDDKEVGCLEREDDIRARNESLGTMSTHFCPSSILVGIFSPVEHSGTQ